MNSTPILFLKYQATGYAAVFPEDKNGRAPIQMIEDWTEALGAESPVMILELQDPDDEQVTSIGFTIDNTRQMAYDLITELVKTGDPRAKVLQRIMNLPCQQISQMAALLDDEAA